MTTATGKGAGRSTRRDVLRGSSLALGGLAVGGGLLRSGRAPAAAPDAVGRHAAQCNPSSVGSSRTRSASSASWRRTGLSELLKIRVSMVRLTWIGLGRSSPCW